MINQPNIHFFDARFDYNIPDDYQVGVLKRTSEKGLLDKLVKENISEYVIEPSHEITIAFDTRDESRGFKSVGHFLYFDILSIDDQWYFIYKCLGPGYKQFSKITKSLKVKTSVK